MYQCSNLPAKQVVLLNPINYLSKRTNHENAGINGKKNMTHKEIRGYTVRNNEQEKKSHAIMKRITSVVLPDQKIVFEKGQPEALEITQRSNEDVRNTT